MILMPMDRIHKFIAKRPGKNHRIIEYNNESYTITKPDMSALHQYRHNRCLTELNLYTPLNTQWSSETQPGSLKRTHRRVPPVKQRSEGFKERVRNFVPKEFRDVNEIKDLWVEDVLDDTEHIIEFNKITDEGIKGPFMDKRSGMEDVKYALKKVSDEYFMPEKKRVKIESLLPGGFVCDDEMHVGKHYEFGSRIRDFSMCKDEFVVVFEDSLSIYEFRNKKETFSRKIDQKVVKAQLRQDILIIGYANNIEAISWRHDSIAYVDNIESFKDIKYADASKTKDSILLSCKDKIKDFDFQNHRLAFITGKVVLVNDMETKKCKVIKFKTEIPLGLQFETHLHISTSNGFYIYSLEEDKYIKTMHFSFVHTFSANNHFAAICDKESRITIYSNGIKNVLDQNKYIRAINAHPTKGIFTVAFADYVYIFKVSSDADCQCSIVGRIEGRFRKVQYDLETDWVYAIRKNTLVIYT